MFCVYLGVCEDSTMKKWKRKKINFKKKWSEIETEFILISEAEDSNFLWPIFANFFLRVIVFRGRERNRFRVQLKRETCTTGDSGKLKTVRKIEVGMSVCLSVCLSN